MNVEAMTPEGGVERLMIDNVEHFRLVDVARAHPNLQPDYRWLHVTIHDQAMSLLRSQAGIVGVKITTGSARGYFVPLIDLPAVERFFANSQTRYEAFEMRWKVTGAARAAAKRAIAIASATLPIPPAAIAPPPVIPPFAQPSKETTLDMTPLAIEQTAASPGVPKVFRFTAANLPNPIHYALTPGAIFIAKRDLFSTFTMLHPDNLTGPVTRFLAGLPSEEYFGIVAQQRVGRSGGRATKFVHEKHLDEILSLLSKREDYAATLATPFMRRMAELRALVAVELSNLSLDAGEKAMAGEAKASAQRIAEQAIGTHDLPLPLPVPPEVMPPYPQTATAGIEELKTIQFDPKSKADQLLERMAASEAAQLKVAEAMERFSDRLEDAVETLRLAQAGIERRDEQIASLERLIALAGQHLTAAVRHHS